MRVNVYAEEMTDRVEIITKTVNGQDFTGLRIYLELPVTMSLSERPEDVTQVRGPFVHRPGDDDSSAVTFWGKRDLREVLKKALALLDAHYEQKPRPLEWRREHESLWVHPNGAMVRRSAIDEEYLCFGPGTTRALEPVPSFLQTFDLEYALLAAEKGKA